MSLLHPIPQLNTNVSKRHYRLSLKQWRMLYRSPRAGSMPQPHCQKELNLRTARSETVHLIY